MSDTLPTAAQTQIEGLVIERDALLARVAELERRTVHNAVYDATKQVLGLQTQVAGLVLERDALRAEITQLRQGDA